MANDTINEIFYEHLINDSALNAAVDNISYILNESNIKNNYAVTYMVDDPKDRLFLCADDEGQARFECILFHTQVSTGVNNRQIFQDTAKSIASTTVGDYRINDVNIVNVSDSATNINDLFEFSFEFVISWEK